MRKIIITLSIVIAALFAGLAPASADSQLPPCEFEDSQNCYWDASERGNGVGNDFIDVDGVVTYTTPEVVTYVAPAPVVQHVANYTDTTAWNLFDAVHAADLLPSSASVVTYVGHSTTPVQPTAGTIVVWDTVGNYYTFAYTAY